MKNNKSGLTVLELQIFVRSCFLCFFFSCSSLYAEAGLEDSALRLLGGTLERRGHQDSSGGKLASAKARREEVNVPDGLIEDVL